jgi:hypothetical protein
MQVSAFACVRGATAARLPVDDLGGDAEIAVRTDSRKVLSGALRRLAAC